MRSRTEVATGTPSLQRDFHGIDGDDAALGDGLGSFAFQRLGLVLGIGELGAGKLLDPAAVGGEVDDDAVDEAVGGDDVRHRRASPQVTTARPRRGLRREVRQPRRR